MQQVRSLAVALVLGVLAPVAVAEEIIPLREGPPIVGEVVKVEGDTFKLRAGDALLSLEFAKVEPAALYRLLHARTALDKAAKRLDLSDTMLRFGGFHAARAELRAAKALDPTRRNDVAIKLADVDDAEARFLYGGALEDLARKRFADAVTKLQSAVTRFAGSPAAEKARTLLPRAREQAAKQKKAAPAAPKKRTSSSKQARLAKYIARTLKRVDTHLSEATAALKTGYRWESKGKAAKAAKAYGASVDKAREALRWITRILEVRVHAPKESVASAQDRRVKLERHLVLVYRAEAALYMVGKNFKRARSAILMALEIDPENKGAFDLKAKIEAEMLRTVSKKDDGTKTKRVRDGHKQR